MILYKVISRERTSCSVDEKDKIYILKYQKGKIVHKVPGTVGIFCFKEFNDAFRFHKHHAGCRVIKVRSIGEEYVPNSICPLLHCSLTDFYSKNKDSIDPPKGTVCCDSVEVLE